jgi:hypothetical protein
VADIDIAYDPITVNSGPVSVGINGLDNIKISVPDPIKTESTFKHPDTFKSDSKFALSIPEPIQTDSKLDVNAGIDVQPLVLDQCLRISLGPLPPTHICFPNRQHVALSLFGVEIVGVTLQGESRVVIGEPQKQTRVVGQNHKTTIHKGHGLKARSRGVGGVRRESPELVSTGNSGDVRIRLG